VREITIQMKNVWMNTVMIIWNFAQVAILTTLVAATREIGLEVSADKTKYMDMSGDQNEDEFTVWGLIVPPREWKSWNIWEQL